MLIIFDLDDTLIDTSGSIVGPHLKSVINYLSDKGLELNSLEGGYAMLDRLNAAVKGTQDSLYEFLEIHDASQDHYRLAVDWMDQSDVGQVTPLPGALALLQELCQEHELVIVTIGESKRQFAKLAQAQIPLSLFKKIVVCDDKKKIYNQLLEEFPYSPERIVVIGDRIHRDLAPGKALGFKTIHIKWGRGLNCIDERGEVDHTIWRLSDCKKILSLINNFQEKHDN